MAEINSNEEFAKRYNKICIKLKDILDEIFNQDWEISSTRTIEADLANDEKGYYADDLVEIIDYYQRYKSNEDYEENNRELKTLLNYVER